MKLFRHILLTLTALASFITAGEYADAFLLASLYPQVQSMGHSTVGVSVHDGHALNNPAGFHQNGFPRVSLVYEQFGGLSNNIGLETNYPINTTYNLGLTVIHNSIDDLFNRPNLSGLTPEIRRDSVLSLDGLASETISYREDALFVSLAREFEFEINLGWKFFKIPIRLPVGVSLKYIDKLLADNRGLGTGIDFGSQLFFNLAGMSDVLTETEFSAGLMVTDILNSPVYWDSEHQDAIKRNFTMGYSVSQEIDRFDAILTLSTATQSRYEDSRQYGAELKIKDMVYFRGGHDGVTPSFGLGIGFKKFIIGYTFSQHDLADMQKIGINYHF